MKKRLGIFFLTALIIFFPLYSIVFFKGNEPKGFSFELLKISVDSLRQIIFVCSREQIFNNSFGAYSISVYDIKNDQSKNSFRFVPVVTKSAFVNEVLETNPLYGSGFSSFNLLLGLKFEPKWYPMIVPIDSSKIYIMTDLEIYSGNKNKLVVTDDLLDSEGDPGEIHSISSVANNFSAAVLKKGELFDGDGNICNIYDYSVKENIIPVPGSSNYLTKLQLNNTGITQLSNTNSEFLVGDDASVTLRPGYLNFYGEQNLGKKYFSVSGQGASGIKLVSLYGEPILLKESEAALDGNNIVATNIANRDFYINFLSSLYTSTGLSYLLAFGGRDNSSESKSSVYALPLINGHEDASLIGTLANVNISPKKLFDQSSLRLYLGNILQESPTEKGDLYTEDSIPAKVGGGMLAAYQKNNIVNVDDYRLRITDGQGYKDTVFVSSVYDGNLTHAVGGIFYSQALFDEHGQIKKWSRWQRKNIFGNMFSQAYIPTLGSSAGIPKNNKKSVVAASITQSGPFLNHTTKAYTGLPCSKSGIEKIIDIPWSHPGIGLSIVEGTTDKLSPSYFLGVGYNTVILQYTAKNNDFFPITKAGIVSCVYGTTAAMKNKDHNTSIVTFQGGSLSKSGALFTGALAYTDSDCWMVVGGAGGLFILMHDDGSGLGSSFLQNHFEGIDENMHWEKIGSFQVVKKIVSNKDFLYIITNKGVFRLAVKKENFLQKKECKSDHILSSWDLPEANENSSFSDGVFSNNVCLLATSCGLVTNSSGSSIKNCQKMPIKKIELPEAMDAEPISLYPITTDGNMDSWGIGSSAEIFGNIYLLATSVSMHTSKVYRFVTYGNNEYDKNTIFLLPNFFVQDIPTYYYNPNMELLSLASDGASLFSHGVLGNSIIFRCYIGILNPLLRHGKLKLKNEYNFFEFYSKSNSYLGFPTYISGNGIWMFSSQSGFEGMC